MRQGAGTRLLLHASPLSVSLSFTSLKLFLYTYPVVRVLYLVHDLRSIRSIILYLVRVLDPVHSPQSAVRGLYGPVVVRRSCDGRLNEVLNVIAR